MPNPQNLKNFTSNDPRINRNGRPKSFDKLRKLALEIAEREVIVFDRKDVMERITGAIKLIEENKTPQAISELQIIMDRARKRVSVVEAILLKMAMGNKDTAYHKFLEICYGKVPDDVNISGDGAIKLLVEYVNQRKSQEIGTSPNS